MRPKPGNDVLVESHRQLFFSRRDGYGLFLEETPVELGDIGAIDILIFHCIKLLKSLLIDRLFTASGLPRQDDARVLAALCMASQADALASILQTQFAV